MKAIVNTAPGRLEWREFPLPKPRAGEVRIRTGACGVCATDLAMIAGWERTGFPSIPGHEWSGTVDAAGRGVSKSLVGRRCVGENVLSRGGEPGSRRGPCRCLPERAAAWRDRSANELDNTFLRRRLRPMELKDGSGSDRP